MEQDNLTNKEWRNADVDSDSDARLREDDNSVPEEPRAPGEVESVDAPTQELPELGAEDDENSEMDEVAKDSVEDVPIVPDGDPDEDGAVQELPMGESAEAIPHNPSKLDQAIADVNEEVKKLQKEVAEIREKERIRLGDDFFAMMLWSRKREKIEPLDDTFYAFEDAWKKALAMIEPLRPYIENRIYKDVLFSVSLHYIICEPYFFEAKDEDGNIIELENPLYKKHNIASKAYIISSASDESSSSSIHVTKSLNDGDFIMQDLLRTRYGTWVYSILEQLDIGAVLL